MRTINNKTELAEFFRDELLPYYEEHYSEDLTIYKAEKLVMEDGLCLCARYKFGTSIYEIMGKIIGDGEYLTKALMRNLCSAKESLLPRIEWMKQFITENKRTILYAIGIIAATIGVILLFFGIFFSNFLAILISLILLTIAIWVHGKCENL